MTDRTLTLRPKANCEKNSEKCNLWIASLGFMETLCDLSSFSSSVKCSNLSFRTQRNALSRNKINFDQTVIYIKLTNKCPCVRYSKPNFIFRVFVVQLKFYNDTLRRRKLQQIFMFIWSNKPNQTSKYYFEGKFLCKSFFRTEVDMFLVELEAIMIEV